MTSEEEDNFQLRKASEHITHCRELEITARRELVEAETATKRAREKHAQLFSECEARAVTRRKTGQIENYAGY